MLSSFSSGGEEETSLAMASLTTLFTDEYGDVTDVPTLTVAISTALAVNVESSFPDQVKDCNGVSVGQTISTTTWLTRRGIRQSSSKGMLWGRSSQSCFSYTDISQNISHYILMLLESDTIT